tara:strand:+ start:551 stop:883 length:333 start_codon:yes stop_codon:yes gene_type:complete
MYIFDTLINNPLFMSGAFILNMFGGRMMFQDMQPYIQGQMILKYVFIFCLFLIATKDINISFILIVVYIIFIQLIKDLYPNNKKEDESKEEKGKYIDSCIDILNNVKQTL